MFPAPGAAAAAAPAVPAPLPILTTQQAEMALAAAFADWKSRKVKSSNAPQNCPRIARYTWERMRSNWPSAFVPHAKVGRNTINQSSGVVQFNSQGIKKWVTVSVSGARGTHDLHAMSNKWSGGFLFHFQVV